MISAFEGTPKDIGRKGSNFFFNCMQICVIWDEISQFPPFPNRDVRAPSLYNPGNLNAFPTQQGRHFTKVQKFNNQSVLIALNTTDSKGEFKLHCRVIDIVSTGLDVLKWTTKTPPDAVAVPARPTQTAKVAERACMRRIA